MESDDLYTGPSVLAPGAPRRADALARFLVWPLLIALFTVTLVFYVLYSPLHIEGDSMYPTLREGERILRTKHYDAPVHGDIVIIDSESPSDTDDIVKRVIGVPGDTIEIRDDVALVNGRSESLEGLTIFEGRGFYQKPVVIPDGYVYVMGDNRPVSLDSRMIGAVPVTKVRGKAVLVFAPIYSIRVL